MALKIYLWIQNYDKMAEIILYILEVALYF